MCSDTRHSLTLETGPYTCIRFRKCTSTQGAILEKRCDVHPPSWLVVSAGQQKRFQKLGDFFEDKSSDFGSTSSRGRLISILYHSLYLHAIVTQISRHCLLGSSLPLPSAMIAQSVSAKLGLGQIS